MKEDGLEHVDAVVVGSGFGGSVAAFRLADDARSVVVLERGRRYPPGGFPRTPEEMSRNFWDPSVGLYGLFDVLSFRKLDAVVASGLGGGSLLYANVLMRKDEKWFVHDEPLPGGGYEHWPISRADLDPHYDAVERMLTPTPIPLGMPGFHHVSKALAMKDAAELLGIAHYRPPLGITFSTASGRDPEPGQPIEEAEYGNIHNMTRRTCRLCGECNIGCNDGAKNSMDHTYLSVAKAKGADIRTSCEVTTIVPQEGGGYVVGYVEHTPGRPTRRIRCERLILAAGTFGTVKLLLRNRNNLPGLSPALGRRFSGNGDLLGFMLKATSGEPRKIQANRGPVITTALRFPDVTDGKQGARGCYVQDAGYPAFVDWLVEGSRLGRVGGRVMSYLGGRLARAIRTHSSLHQGGEIAALLGSCVLSDTSMPLLAMGREKPEGVLHLRRGQLELEWDAKDSHEYFTQAREHMRHIAQAAGGQYKDNPMWLANRLITVHPIGGAAMAEHPSEGVCDPHGEVFGFPGLYLADGSVLPGSVGPNPALTIAAWSDRMCDRLLSEIDEPAQPVAPLPRSATRLAAEPSVHFEEMMAGPLSEGQSRITLNLVVDIPNLNVFLSDPRHEAKVSGTIECDAVGGRFRIVDGEVRMLVEVDGTRQRQMLYRLQAVGPLCQTITVLGCKKVRSRTPLGLWRDTTRMRVQVYSWLDRNADGTPFRGAVVSLSPKQLLHAVLRLRASGPNAARTKRRFLTFFARSLWEVVMSSRPAKVPCGRFE